jgi:hypothetical protein
MRPKDRVWNSRDIPPCPKERGEQERLPQGGPSFGPFVGDLDSREKKSPPNQTKPNQTSDRAYTLSPVSRYVSGLRREPGFHDMFHDMLRYVSRYRDMLLKYLSGPSLGPRLASKEKPTKPNPICFTICLFISPDLDLDQNQTNLWHFLDTLCLDSRQKKSPPNQTICFTICLFISPDLDGNRGTSTKNVPRETHKPNQCGSYDRPRYVSRYVSRLFISPDLDGNRDHQDFWQFAPCF